MFPGWEAAGISWSAVRALFSVLGEEPGPDHGRARYVANRAGGTFERPDRVAREASFACRARQFTYSRTRVQLRVYFNVVGSVSSTIL